MHTQPPRTLKRLLKQYGQELIDDPRRTEALLRDHCGQYTREIFVLVNAQKQHVPNDLLSAPTWMPRQATYTRLSKHLQTKLALTEDAANWAVAAWAAALDIESLSKGDSWSWLPEPLRGPTPKSKRKSGSKKRQNSASQVKSSKSVAVSSVSSAPPASSASALSPSAAKLKERSARAEDEVWSFPKFAFTTLNRASQSRLFQFRLFKTPIIWSNLLPLFALLAATIFLLAVVYWTSITRPVIERDMSNPAAAPASTQATDAASAAPFEAGASTASALNVTPLPDLPQPAGDYLSKVMTLPAKAYANVPGAPLFVRSAPSTTEDHVGILNNRQAVNVISFSDDGQWSQITYPTGWVSNQFLNFQSASAPDSYVTLSVRPRYTQDHEVTVRTEPDASAEVASTLPPNQFVIVAAEAEANQPDEPPAWYQIADPVVGWVAAADLTPGSP